MFLCIFVNFKCFGEAKVTHQIIIFKKISKQLQGNEYDVLIFMWTQNDSVVVPPSCQERLVCLLFENHVVRCV